jgi:CrcB protein
VRARFAVVGGGVIGTLVRYAVGEIVTPSGVWPWSTFIVNIVGAAVLGYVTGRFLRHPSAHPLWRPLVGVGIMGAMTTFGTFTLELSRLIAAGRLAVALAYGAASVVMGMAVAVGMVRLGEVQR